MYTEMYSMPNRDLTQEGEASADESTQWQSGDSDDDESDDSSSSEEVESPPRFERRSKQTHDPIGGRGKEIVSSMHASKRTRATTPVPAEKAPKHPKVEPAKPWKALPKIKVDVPIASA